MSLSQRVQSLSKTASRIATDRARRHYDLVVARREGYALERVRTVCWVAGSYRNLTTLTAGVSALHPHCQVLNHGAKRILAFDDVNVIAHPERFDDYLRYALHLSRGGYRGLFGGSITYSHAFDRAGMASTYRERFGDVLLKADVRAHFWKESHITTNAMRARPGGADALLEAVPKLRLLLPMRHPIDCARSCLRTGHVRFFGLGDAPPIEDVVDHILEIFAWFHEVAERFPERCLSFTELEFDRAFVERYAAFLELEASEPWATDAVACYRVASPYDHPQSLRDHYLRRLEARLGHRPELVERLAPFATR